MLFRCWLIRAGALAWLAWAGLAAAAPPVPLGRLPDSVRPLAYRINLTVDPSQARFAGHTEIDALLTLPTSVIYLHGLGLKMRSVGLSSPLLSGLPETVRYTQVDDSGVVRLDLPLTMPPGRVTLSFTYTADFRTGAEGLFHARVGDDWYAWTQLEPIDARRVFPCFDQPGFKTPFTISVTAPAGAKVFANAPEISTRRARHGNLLHRFAPTRPLPTYLVAIAVGPFDVIETAVPPDAVRSQPLPLRVIATRGQEARMHVAATEAPKLLVRLERYLGIPYPFAKLDLAASPVQSGAMENAGLILFEDAEILVGPHPTLSQLRAFGVVTAHEMSHQWLGDLVTPAWWDDLWLNESFAEWLGHKIASDWRPDLDIDAGLTAHAFAAMDTDALGHSRPIHQEITDSRQIDSAFDDITYLKGAQVIAMFESYLGPARFQQGVQLHLKSHTYGNATAEDFFRSLATAAGNPLIVAAMRTFIDQTGVPVVTVRADPQGLTLAQARYRPLGVSPVGTQVWSIPMCLSRGTQRSCTLLDQPTVTVAGIPGEGPLVPNAGGSGYYRFRLDAAGWDRLISAAPRLPAREALTVGDSLWADFAAGTGSFSRLVEGARELAEHADALAATELAQPLQSLARSLLTPQELPGYQRLMDSIYGPPLAGLGLDERAGVYAAEPAPVRLLRQSLVPLVALQGRDRPVRLKLANAAQASLNGAPGALDVSLRRTAFKVAVQDLGVPFMEQLQAALLHSSDPLFRADALAALGAADTPALATAALGLAHAPGLQPPETLQILADLTGQPGARSTVVRFINTHMDRVLQPMAGFDRPELVDLLFGDDCAPGDAARLSAWAGTWLKALGGAQLEVTETQERIGRCVALKNVKGSEIAAALGVPVAGSAPQS